VLPLLPIPTPTLRGDAHSRKGDENDANSAVAEVAVPCCWDDDVKVEVVVSTGANAAPVDRKRDRATVARVEAIFLMLG